MEINEQKVIKIESQQCKVVAPLSTNLAFFVMAMGYHHDSSGEGTTTIPFNMYSAPIASVNI